MKTEQGPHERSHFHEQHATNRWLRGKESRTSKVKMDDRDSKGNLGNDQKRLTSSLKICRTRLGKGITQKQIIKHATNSNKQHNHHEANAKPVRLRQGGGDHRRRPNPFGQVPYAS